MEEVILIGNYLLHINKYIYFKSKSIPQPQDTLVILTSMIAISSGSICIDLQDIPSQPITFMVNIFVLIIFEIIFSIKG